MISRLNDRLRQHSQSVKSRADTENHKKDSENSAARSDLRRNVAVTDGRDGFGGNVDAF